MTELNHRDYYIGRADVSRRLAQQATNPQIAAIHREFANRYEATIRLVVPGARRPG